MVTDRIGDFINRVKTATWSGKERIFIPYSKLIHQIAKVLEKEGYISTVDTRGDGISKVLVVDILPYHIDQAKRVSKPGRRLYWSVKDIVPIKGKKGTAVLSTSSGILTGYEARQKGVAGEILFTITKR